MNKSLVLGAIAVVAVFAGVIWWKREPAQQAASPAVAEPAPGEPPRPARPEPTAVSRSTAGSRPVPSDPRLASLMVSPENALIEFFSDPQGRVIREIDNDPNSAGYRKPLREYTYAGDQVIRLVSYRYLGDQVQVVTADVTYRPDGSVDQFHESTRYEMPMKAGGPG